jgi:hypothetical protein
VEARDETAARAQHERAQRRVQQRDGGEGEAAELLGEAGFARAEGVAHE